MDFGTSVHGAIEKYRTKKDPITIDQALVVFEEKFKQLYTENKEKYRDREKQYSYDEFVESGKRIIQDLNSCIELRDCEVLFNEYPLKLNIDRTDGLEMYFKGFVDMIIKWKDGRGNPVIYIIDFKTCSWGWTVDKKTNRDLHAQLFLYKHFFSKKFNLNPKEIRVAFVLLKKKPQPGKSAVEFFPVSAGPVSVQRALDELNSDMTEMKRCAETNDFKKNRDACVSPFGDVCPYLNTPHCPGEKDGTQEKDPVVV